MKKTFSKLSPKLKGSRWKKKQNAIYCEVDGYYFDVFINVFLNDSKTTFRMSAKPMSLDKLYWKITDLEDNDSQPLSFRTWGAFTCSGLPLDEKSIVDEGVNADVLASSVVEWAKSQVETALPKLDTESFSSAVARHPNQLERGAYAITYVTSLISEGNLDTARQAAVAYANGSAQSIGKHMHAGRDFHEIAVEWIDSAVSAG
ncbi:MAG: hypothetical protein AAGJ86_01590 [Pseudomonadota bacterium]